VDARERHHLSHAQVQMARELGLKPKKLGKMDNHDQQPWKMPLRQYIEHLYFKHFRKEQPDVVLPIEKQVHAEKEKTAKKRQEAATSGPPHDKIGPAWVAVVEILKRIEVEPFHWPGGRTTFQKIAYFATECGIPTGLKYQRGSYGPYAPALKERITALVNNGLVLEEKLGQMFAIHVGQTFLDARKAYELQIRDWEPIIDKVADLFMRMNTQQAEVAATVLFAAQEAKIQPEESPAEKDIHHTVMTWQQKERTPLDETCGKLRRTWTEDKN